MKYFFTFILSISFLSCIQAQAFTKESPYILLRLMDLKLHEWKSDILDRIEKTLDSELKHTDEKKGIACKTIDFEQEAGYPRQDARFLDLSFRGICTDEKGKQHPIDKDLITKAIIRKKNEVNAATSQVVFRIGNVQLYERNRNKLNLIIIPGSIGFILFLTGLTFFLRRMRNQQKRRHIMAELQKKREATLKKAQTKANVDPHANDKQRLLQPDSTVVGNVSGTMGSPKVFTNEPPPPPSSTSTTRNTTTNTSDHRLFNREYQEEAPPPIPPKDNRPPYYNRDDDRSFQTQRSFKSSRERMHVPYETEKHFSPTRGQYQEMVSMHEQHPRVVVRSVRDDENYPTSYRQQSYEESAKTFVSIPVQIEHSNSHQRFVPPPYHSDPYYPHVNS